MNKWIIKKITIRNWNKKYPFLIEGINECDDNKEFVWQVPDIDGESYKFEMETNVFFEYKRQSNCDLGCKTHDDCPSIDSNFAGGCEQCAYNKRLN